MSELSLPDLSVRASHDPRTNSSHCGTLRRGLQDGSERSPRRRNGDHAEMDCRIPPPSKSAGKRTIPRRADFTRTHGRRKHAFACPLFHVEHSRRHPHPPGQCSTWNNALKSAFSLAKRRFSRSAAVAENVPRGTFSPNLTPAGLVGVPMPGGLGQLGQTGG